MTHELLFLTWHFFHVTADILRNRKEMKLLGSFFWTKSLLSGYHVTIVTAIALSDF